MPPPWGPWQVPFSPGLKSDNKGRKERLHKPQGLGPLHLFPPAHNMYPLAVPSRRPSVSRGSKVREQLLWMTFYFAFHILFSFTFSQAQQLQQPPRLPSLKTSRQPQLRPKAKHGCAHKTTKKLHNFFSLHFSETNA